MVFYIKSSHRFVGTLGVEDFPHPKQDVCRRLIRSSRFSVPPSPGTHPNKSGKIEAETVAITHFVITYLHSCKMCVFEHNFSLPCFQNGVLHTVPPAFNFTPAQWVAGRGATSARAQLGLVVKNFATQKEHERLCRRRKTTEKPNCVKKVSASSIGGRRGGGIQRRVPQKTAEPPVP